MMPFVARAQPTISGLLALMFAAAAVGCDGVALTTHARSTTPRVIAFSVGPPYPPEGTAALVARISDATPPPVDGAVVNLGFANSAWSRTTDKNATWMSVADAIGGTPRPQLTELFAQLQLVGSIDWTDDAAFDAYAATWQTLGAVSRRARMRGLFVDPLPYGSRLWDVPAGRTLDELAPIVKARGLALARALFGAYPDAVIVLAVGYSEALRQVCLDEAPTPLAETPWALYPSFLDGVLAARDETRGQAQVVDAFLPSYPAKSPEAFRLFYDVIHFRWDAVVAHWRPGVETVVNARGSSELRAWPQTASLRCSSAELLALSRDLPAALSLMPDYGSWAPGAFHPEPERFADNWFRPDELETALTGALRATDRYVFVWTGATSLWDGADVPLPVPYLDAMRRARAAAAPSR